MAAVASLQPSALVYREEQNFGWWVYALAVQSELLTSVVLYWIYQRGQEPTPLSSLALSLLALVGLAAPVLVVVGLLRMTTEVTPTDVWVWFGWVPTYRRFLPISAVRRVEVVTYRPVLDCGGWGIRTGLDGERVLNARGNRGVRLDLADGSRLLIGSQNPEALALAIERATLPGV